MSDEMKRSHPPICADGKPLPPPDGFKPPMGANGKPLPLPDGRKPPMGH